MKTKIKDIEYKKIITKQGKERRLIIFNCSNNIQVLMFGNPRFSFIHPKSKLYKLLNLYDCKCVKELIGKEVPIYFDNKINKFKFGGGG